MKKLALTVILLIGAAGPLLADTAAKGAEKSDAPRTATASRPVLDQTKTHSIERPRDSTQKPAKKRERSGLEVNPWIVPSFR